MTKRCLLVLSRQDGGLHGDIQKAFELQRVQEGLSSIDVEWATDEARALRSLGDREFDYIVVGLRLARNPSTPLTEEGGLECCEAVRQCSNAPIALLVPQLNNEIQRRTQVLGNVLPLALSRDIVKELAGLVDASERPRKRLDVIVITREGTDWEYELHGVGFAYTRAGTLRMRRALPKAWRGLARAIEQSGTQWYNFFKELGESIIEAFCESSDEFRDQVDAGLEQAGGIANTRVTFVVAPAHYPIVLEAIFPPPPAQVPWMIHAPMLRNVAGSGVVSPDLFEEVPRPLNCLIVAADTRGPVDEVTHANGDVIDLPELSLVGAESRALKQLLDRAALRPELGKRRVLEITDEQELTPNRFLEVLGDERWDIVHFAGHSYFDEDRSDHGYLFVGKHDEPKPIKIKDIGPHLRDSKLVYLSSCQSTTVGFAVEAAKQRIPAVIGFRWLVDDGLAALHARLFYRRLFRFGSIDTAFWSTRRAIHRHFGEKNNAWASSMLLTGPQ